MSSRTDRLLQIVEILGRHGLGFAITQAGLGHWLPAELRRRIGHDPAVGTDPSLPARIRLAAEELGVVYVKLGQILSTRADLLPPEFINELAKLQDSSPQVPAAEIRAAIAAELGPIATTLLATLHDEPLATGSIGQAHLAVVDGVSVVVKTRRPDIVEQVNQDLDILTEFAKRAEQASRAVAGFQASGMVEEFAQTLRAELDYTGEGRNAERFAENFAGSADVRIPRIFWEQTTSRVLCIELMGGIKVNNVAALIEAGLEPGAVARRACNVLLKMVLEDGFFHADPHPGNFFVEPDGRLAIIDFGMVGKISADQKALLAQALMGIVNQDARVLAKALIKLCESPGTPNVREVELAVGRLLGRYTGRPLAEIPLVPVVLEVLAVLRRQNLRLPRETALMLKMFIMADGLGKQLDPGFELTTELGPFAQRLVKQSFSPEAIAARLKKAGAEALLLGSEAPDMLRRVMEVIDSGGFDIRLRAEELDALLEKADRTGNRIVAGIVSAALITAIGELVAGQPGRWQSWPKALFTAGIGGVGALGGYLLWTTRRKR